MVELGALIASVPDIDFQYLSLATDVLTDFDTTIQEKWNKMGKRAMIRMRASIRMLTSLLH